jgi:hypothetical protein
MVSIGLYDVSNPAHYIVRMQFITIIHSFPGPFPGKLDVFLSYQAIKFNWPIINCKFAVYIPLKYAHFHLKITPILRRATEDPSTDKLPSSSLHS